MTADGLAEKAGTGGEFWVRVRGIRLEKAKSSEEMGTVGGREVGERGLAVS